MRRAHALALGVDAQPGDRLVDDARQVNVVVAHRRVALLDLGQVEQLVDHLHEMARLDIDLGDRLAHARRQLRALCLEHQRLGQQAHRAQRRAQLVRQVAHELGPDAAQPDQLRNISQGEPDAAVIGLPHVQRKGFGRLAGKHVLARRVAVAPCLGGELLDAVIQERLEHALADEATRPPAEQVCGGSIGRVDRPRGADADKADAQLISGLELFVKLLDGRSPAAVVAPATPAARASHWPRRARPASVPG